MRYIPRVLPPLIAAFCLSICSGEESQAELSHRVLLVVHHSEQNLIAGTAVVGRRQQLNGKAGWAIENGAQGQLHWVSNESVTPLEARARELRARSIAERVEDPSKYFDLPSIIRLQDNPVVQKAWNEVAAAVKENESLPETSRLPEPYFARAEIWASVANYSDALQDLLTGVKYVRLSNRDLFEYRSSLERLHEVAEKLQSVPVAAKGTDSSYADVARRHYSLGYSSFFAGQPRAAMHHFDNAVQLETDQPLYWYFRSLSYREMGDSARANHDALMGAAFERAQKSNSRRLLNRSLMRVQGERRSWLEQYRTGLANQHLVGHVRGWPD